MSHIIFTNKNIGVAVREDISSITKLLNSAYRGESSKQGWTTEAHLIAGDVRTDEHNVLEVMQQPNSVFLKYVSDDAQLFGCVNLQKHDNRIYLGMFSVSPSLQGGGIGKQLLKAAEEYTIQMNCKAIYMMVISLRKELIDWYKRKGYVETGETKPFIEDNLTGKHLQQLEFVILEKKL